MKTQLIFFLLLISGFITEFGAADEKDKTANVAGEWSVTIKFIAGECHHTVTFTQKGDTLSGIYKGSILKGTLRGTVKGNTVNFTGRLKYESTGILFHYTGTIEGNTMEGSNSAS